MKDNKDHIKRVNKLDKLPKKQVYSVPDGYFDNLPTIIQARIAKPEARKSWVINWSSSLKFVLPGLALVLMVTYFSVRLNNKSIDVQAMLDEVPTEELVSFLTESDISADELLSIVDLEAFDVDGMVEEDIQLLDDNEWDDILEEYPDLEIEI